MAPIVSHALKPIKQGDAVINFMDLTNFELAH